MVGAIASSSTKSWKRGLHRTQEEWDEKQRHGLGCLVGAISSIAQWKTLLQLTCSPVEFGDTWIERESTYLSFANGNRYYVQLELVAFERQSRDIPSEIGLLTNLEYLSLHNNNFTWLPSEGLKLTQMQELYLDWKLMPVIPTELYLFTNLTSFGRFGSSYNMFITDAFLASLRDLIFTRQMICLALLCSGISPQKSAY
jgi:hypothetical protein